MHGNTIEETWWEWFEARAHSTHALLWLALVSFIEPIFLPLMPEVVMAPLILAKRDHWKTYVAVTIGASILGGIAGYFIGSALLSLPLFAHWGVSPWFHVIERRLARHVFWVMLLLMFSPAPDKLFVLLAGFFHVPFIPYIIGFGLGRVLRFSLVGFLVQRFGPQVLSLVRDYFEWLAAAVLLFISVAVLHLFHFV